MLYRRWRNEIDCRIRERGGVSGKTTILTKWTADSPALLGTRSFPPSSVPKNGKKISIIDSGIGSDIGSEYLYEKLPGWYNDLQNSFSIKLAILIKSLKKSVRKVLDLKISRGLFQTVENCLQWPIFPGIYTSEFSPPLPTQPLFQAGKTVVFANNEMVYKLNIKEFARFY